MQFLFNFLLIFIPSLVFSQMNTYKGFCDKYPITFITNTYSDGLINAIYVLDNQDNPIGLSGVFNNEKLNLIEKDSKGRVLATLEFSNYNSEEINLLGKWTSKNTSEEYTIKLQKVTESDFEILQVASTKTHYFKTILSKNENETTIIGLKILEKKTDKLVQSFKIDGESRDFNCVNVNDYNFDTIDDFSVFEASYAGANTTRIYFLYDPKKQKYFQSDYEGTSLEFDTKKKLVYEYNSCCAGSSIQNTTYKIENNKMVPIQKKCLQYDEKKQKMVVIKCN